MASLRRGRLQDDLSTEQLYLLADLGVNSTRVVLEYSVERQRPTHPSTTIKSSSSGKNLKMDLIASQDDAELADLFKKGEECLKSENI